MKNKLRKELLEKRKKLSEKEVIAKSKKIKERLFELNEFKKASRILFYVSYDNEVNTHDMIKECISSGREIAVPITNKKDRSLSLSKLEKWDDLTSGSYGILEPKKEKVKEIEINEVDLIIVPGVVFDKNGNRVGHGKGYYDSLLSKYRGKTVALAFQFQMVDKIPTEPRDRKVDVIVTEKEVIYC